MFLELFVDVLVFREWSWDVFAFQRNSGLFMFVFEGLSLSVFFLCSVDLFPLAPGRSSLFTWGTQNHEKQRFSPPKNLVFRYQKQGF